MLRKCAKGIDLNLKLIMTIIVVIIFAEIALFILVRSLRKNFPWLITQQDEIPQFDLEALRKFIKYSFDANLGWVRKPNSSGIEHGQKGEIEFKIDSTGSRVNHYENLTPEIASFGDSYVFCRQVGNDETWQAQISNQTGLGVLNYGVGNYGLDQALMRYEGMTLPNTVEVVIMGFVPETICRIQSYWKHYLEFGNTFAFKPRYILLPNGELLLQENKIKNEEDFLSLESKLPYIRSKDRFYKSKFLSLQFRFPYLLSLARNPIRQIKLISLILIKNLLKLIGISSSWSESLPFTLVMKDNIRNTHKLYTDTESTELLNALLLRFKDLALSRGHIPLVLVMPQLLDLKLESQNNYQSFFQKVSSSISVIDVTNKFINQEIDKLYVNDQYGGHLSVYGNSLVAQEISTWFNSIKQNI